ncbi:MAG: hypothetical protein IIU16_03540 [Bacteroidales bacterium]|nr:hypothetical protein [Bacteroidales bacterium]MBQ9529808.1 hypothetical protein [Bacteroidales bacterium]
METGLLIFLIWFMLAAIGVAASIKKRAKKVDQALNQKAAREEEAERRIREFYENMRSDTSMEEEPESPAEEAQPVTPRKSEPAPAAKAAAQPAAEPVKKKEMDFDPEEMVIYSEVMKPGYEKY